MMGGVFGLQLVAGLGGDEARAGLGILEAILDAFLGGGQVFLGMEGREEEGFGGVVEAFAPGTVGGQVVAGVYVNVEEVAQGGPVFVAIQATDGGGARLDAVGTGSGAQGIVEAGDELFAGAGGGRLGAGRGHVAVANALQHTVPGALVVIF